MECPKCHSENREGVKFREDCGARMEVNARPVAHISL
jgi:hypothetical protein